MKFLIMRIRRYIIAKLIGEDLIVVANVTIPPPICLFEPKIGDKILYRGTLIYNCIISTTAQTIRSKFVDDGKIYPKY